MAPDAPGSASLTLASDVTAPGAARRFVADLMAGVDPDTVYDLLVAVSELVTNSVRHGRPPITVQVERDDATVTVRVHDLGEALPSLQLRSSPVTALSGRGLPIIASVGSGWGLEVDPVPPGKTVWVEVSITPRTTTVALQGDLDVATNARTAAIVRTALGRAGAGGVVVDLGDVSFIDSSGLGMLVELHQAAAAAGQSLGITGMSPRIVRTLQIAGLDTLFDD